MENKLTAEVSVTIDATANEVWEAITNPDLIKQYLYETNVTSDWKEGSTITYEGEHEGKKYHDKGVIKKLEEPKVFESTYWSSMGGKEDKPENYNTVTYTLSEKDEQTTVTLKQDNILSEDEKQHASTNWQTTLEKLKEVVEKNRVGSPYRTII